MSDHSSFPPSSAYRWMQCPNGRSQQSGVSAVAREAGERGRLMHEVAAARITGELEPQSDLNDFEEGLVETYVRYVRTLIADGESEDITYGIESRLYVTCVNPVVWGTCDAFAWVMKEGILYVLDFKTGRVPVAARANIQLILYALGVLSDKKAPEGLAPVETVKLIIVQPGLAHGVRAAELDRNDLLYWRNRLKVAVDAILNGSNVHVPGPWCKYCAKEKYCEALKDIGAVTIAMLQGEDWPINEGYSQDELVAINGANIRNEVRAAEVRVAEDPSPRVTVRKSERRVWNAEAKRLGIKGTQQAFSWTRVKALGLSQKQIEQYTTVSSCKYTISPKR